MPSGQHELTLSNGEKLVTDMYIPTFGLVPNSSYVPAKFLNANGSVIVDEYLNVKAAGAVWAIGDVSDAEPSQFIFCDRQSSYLAKNITLILSNRTLLPYKAATSRMITLLVAELAFWLILLAGLTGLQIGRKAATGHYGNMKIPSFIILWARKTLFIENMGPTVNGSLF